MLRYRQLGAQLHDKWLAFYIIDPSVADKSTSQKIGAFSTSTELFYRNRLPLELFVDGHQTSETS